MNVSRWQIPKLPARRSWGEDDSKVLQRAALWSAYFHRFSGWQGGRHEVPAPLRPMSCNAACEALLKDKNFHPATVKRFLAHMQASGYRPEGEHLERFGQLLNKVRRTSGDFGKLEHVTHEQLKHPSEPPRRTRAKLMARPTQVAYAGDVATLKTETLLRRTLKDVARIVKPQNWRYLGPFFERTDRKTRNELIEQYVIDWNGLRAQQFEVHLKVDYTRSAGRARTDYSLIYDKDDEILVDEGWVEASRIEGWPEDWTRYVAVKKLKFASAFLNLVGPAFGAMFLESQATETLLEAVDYAAKAANP